MASQAIVKCLECLAHTCLWSPVGAAECSHVSLQGKNRLAPGIGALQCPPDPSNDNNYSVYQLGSATAAGDIVGAVAIFVYDCVQHRCGCPNGVSNRRQVESQII